MILCTLLGFWRASHDGPSAQVARWLLQLEEQDQQRASQRFLTINEMLVMIDPQAWAATQKLLLQNSCKLSSRQRIMCDKPQSIEDLARLALAIFEKTAPFVRRIGGSALSPLFGIQPFLNRYDEALAVLAPYNQSSNWLSEVDFDVAIEGLSQLCAAIELGSNLRFEDVESYIFYGSSAFTAELEKFLRLQNF